MAFDDDALREKDVKKALNEMMDMARQAMAGPMMRKADEDRAHVNLSLSFDEMIAVGKLLAKLRQKQRAKAEKESLR